MDINIPVLDPNSHSGTVGVGPDNGSIVLTSIMMDAGVIPVTPAAPGTVTVAPAPAPATMPGKEMHSYLPQIQEGWLNKPLTPAEVILAVLGVLIVIGLLTVISKWIFN